MDYVHPDPDLTQLLQAAMDGDQTSEDEFCRAVYDELLQRAKRLYRPDSQHGSSLVHELYLKLFRRGGLKKAPNRGYFYKVAIDQMRKILIDQHRKRKRLKAGGHLHEVPFDEAMNHVLTEFERNNGYDVEAVEEALARLRQHSERQYQVVVHRFYGGCSVKETASALNISVSTIESDWRLARAKLLTFLDNGTTPEEQS